MFLFVYPIVLPLFLFQNNSYLRLHSTQYKAPAGFEPVASYPDKVNPHCKNKIWKDSETQTDPVDVVVDVEDEGDDGTHEAHVADRVRTARDSLALDVLTLLAFWLKLKFEF